MILKIYAVVSNPAMQSDGIVQWHLMYRRISMYKYPVNVKNYLPFYCEKALKRMKNRVMGKKKYLQKYPTMTDNLFCVCIYLFTW